MGEGRTACFVRGTTSTRSIDDQRVEVGVLDLVFLTHVIAIISRASVHVASRPTNTRRQLLPY